MSTQSSYNIYYFSILLILLSSCNIMDLDFKKLGSGTFDDSPNWGYFPAVHPYISSVKMSPDPAIAGDSLIFTCVLHDSLDVADFFFNWRVPDEDDGSGDPALRTGKNIYNMVAPDSSGIVRASVSVDDDTTDAGTLDHMYFYFDVVAKPE